MSLKNNLLGGIKNKVINAGTDFISGVKNKEGKQGGIRASGLQSFISQIGASNGLFRGTMFEIQISAPSNIFNSDSSRTISLLCHTASLPGITLETTTNTIYQLPYEIPTGVTFDPFFCTCYIDNSFILPNILFSEISNRIDSNQFQNQDLGYGTASDASWSPKYRDPSKLLTVNVVVFSSDPDYGTKVGYTTQSNDGLPFIASYTLKNAFVKTIQQTPLDWGSHDAISTMTMEISYEWFETQMPMASGTNTPIISTKNPINLDTIMAKNPELGIAYDAAKRSIQQSGLMNNSVLNQASQFI